MSAGFEHMIYRSICKQTSLCYQAGQTMTVRVTLGPWKIKIRMIHCTEKVLDGVDMVAYFKSIRIK